MIVEGKMYCYRDGDDNIQFYDSVKNALKGMKDDDYVKGYIGGIEIRDDDDEEGLVNIADHIEFTEGKIYEVCVSKATEVKKCSHCNGEGYEQ